jgi:LDH2 family malate/lactate/ureidoglycolate dehydrogenase
VIDADNTLGHYAGELAVDHAVNIAKTQGISAVSVKHSTHFGAAAYFTNKIAQSDMLGFAFTNTEALVNAFNSKEAFFGTNPFCFSAPMLEEDPFCLDMATSTVPWNKVKNYRRQNIQLDEGWAYDENGILTTDPQAAKSLTAIGGYKGYGLGMVIEILCSGLTQGPISKDIAPLYDISISDKRDISHFFMAIDVSKFLESTLFKSYMNSMINRLRSLPKSSEDSVYVAGDKEKIQYSERSVYGIPMDEVKFKEFLEISNDYKQAVI